MKNKKEDAERIGKVLKHIDQHLDQELALDNLAALAFYSPFHFQRIFKSVVGETPKQYIKRLRLERAAHVIALYPERTMLEVALQVGFHSLEAFSRAFKDYYMVSPDNYRKREVEEKLKTIQHPGLGGGFLSPSHTFLPASSGQSEEQELNIEVVKRPLQKLVYIQTTLENSLQISETFRKLSQWAAARELVAPGMQMLGLIKDYPMFTSLDKCRYLVCLPVEQEPAVSGNVHYLELPEGKYGTFKVHGGIAEVVKGCTYFAHHWLPRHGYRIVQEYALQVPLSDPLTTPFNNNTYQVFVKVSPQ